MNSFTILAVVCLFGYGAMGKVLPAPQAVTPCTDPTQFCATYQMAKSCGTEQFCRQTCWSFVGREEQFTKNYMKTFNRLPEPNLQRLCATNNVGLMRFNLGGATCDQCKNIVTRIDHFLKDSTALDSFLSALRFVCNFMPSGSTTCRNVVDDIQNFVKMVEPFFADSEKVCQLVWLCGHQPDPRMIQLVEKVAFFMQNNTEAGTWCDQCKESCQSLKEQLEDPAQQENLKETFHEVCDYLGPFKGKCDQYIDEFLPKFIEQLITYFSDGEGICRRLGFCANA